MDKQLEFLNELEALLEKYGATICWDDTQERILLGDNESIKVNAQYAPSVGAFINASIIGYTIFCLEQELIK